MHTFLCIAKCPIFCWNSLFFIHKGWTFLLSLMFVGLLICYWLFLQTFLLNSFLDSSKERKIFSSVFNFFQFPELHFRANTQTIWETQINDLRFNWIFRKTNNHFNGFLFIARFSSENYRSQWCGNIFNIQSQQKYSTGF